MEPKVWKGSCTYFFFSWIFGPQQRVMCLLYPQQCVMYVYFIPSNVWCVFTFSPQCVMCVYFVPSNVWCLFSFSTQQHVMCDWFIPVNPNCCLMCCHGFYFCVHLPFDFIHVAKCSHFCIYPKCVWVGLEWNR